MKSSISYKWYSLKHDIRVWKEKLRWWIALKIPPRITLFCYVLVVAASMESPDESYSKHYKAYCKEQGIEE